MGRPSKYPAEFRREAVERWFRSPERAAFFERHGMTVTPFRDPGRTDSPCAVLVDTPDMASLEAALASEEARKAEEHDGVHPDTIRIFVAG